jgi:uncharacterized protein (DUF305 family)
MTHMHWNRLLLMAGLHFVAMYILMYAMVDQFDNVLPNLNQAYMAVIMTSPMLIIEVLLMGSMYGDRKVLAAIVAGSVLVFTAAFVGIRQQAAIGDKEFLRSMIPHHGAAILMCDQAPIDDAEIIELCQQITSSQQAEIDQMKQILERME